MKLTFPLALIGVTLALAACAPRAGVRAVEPDGSVLSRSAWGARAPVAPMRRHDIEWITIHHTATRRNPARSLEEKLRALQAFSQQDAPLADGRLKPAWPDVPYHYYVDHAGRIAEGREAAFAGDTNTDYDPTGHLLIVLEGNFEEEYPTIGQLIALRRLVLSLASRHRIPPERIAGHRDHARTLCPGKHLLPYVAEMRTLGSSAEGESRRAECVACPQTEI